jgi:hypothetical protein
MSSNPMNQAIRAMGNRSRALPDVPDIGQGTPDAASASRRIPLPSAYYATELWEPECQLRIDQNSPGTAAESRTPYDAGQRSRISRQGRSGDQCLQGWRIVPSRIRFRSRLQVR